MSSAVKVFTDNTFEAGVIQTSGLVMVDFWASWCGPCKQIAPILDEIAQDMGGRLIVGKIEIDKNAKTSAAYNVKSVPTLIVFKDGVERARMTGATSKTRLTAFIAGAD